MTTLYEEIVAKCTSEELDERNYHVIADKVNVNRTKITYRTGEIGIGTILEVLGLQVGNALLDAIYANAMFKYVKPLLEQGRLIINSPIVQGTLASLIGQQLSAEVTFTQEHADALNVLSVGPDLVTWTQCQEAVEKGA
ncbi:MAG: hypothetical protein BWY21_00134 [Parcubacteria group bacterium ADurb.Bin216]|nr:MAG: hypothetical protein BWY21_00134 [Parcubacteria group bacterium ADurb.Bin216]